MAEPAFVGRRSIVGALQATGGVFRTAAAASGPLGVPSGSEVVTGRAGCLNWARPDLWEGRRVSAAPTRRTEWHFHLKELVDKDLCLGQPPPRRTDCLQTLF